MKKNTASQSIGAEMITAADGTAFTGAVSVLVTIDNGTQTAGLGAAPVHEGNGYHSYTPTQAETNGDHIAFTFTGTGAIPATIQLYTSYPQSVDNNVILATLPTQSYLDGRTLASASYFDPSSDTVANVTTVANLTTNNDKAGYSISGTKTTLDALNDIAATDIVSSGAITTLAGAVVNVDTVDTTTTNSDMRGTDGANTTTPPTAAQIWSEATRTLTAGDNITLAKGAGITGFNDLSFNDIWTGTITESYAADGAALTPAQGIYMMWSDLRSPHQVSTTWTDYKIDGTTPAMTFVLDDAAAPTRKTRNTV
ncbi:hypothetical protein [Pseudoalteromonas sp.]|uniref:hypothetical protein n=1 Tax=Pseudoalteromonas sp. TaxID=53249 RepID=UPI00356AB510